MGKTIRAQRIGKSPRRRALGHRNKGKIAHQPLYSSKEELVKGQITALVHDPGRTAPMAEARFENNKKVKMVAPVGLSVGTEISYGTNAQPAIGNSLYVSKIPEGTLICNVEIVPGDGGKMARAAGTFIRVATHDPTGTIVQLPSGAFKTIDSKCRAHVGVVSGGGANEKPFVKAGRKRYAKRARGKLHSMVRGIAMNPTDHPFGGGGHPHTGKPKTVSKHAPPGRKVGSIGAKRTGRK